MYRQPPRHLLRRLFRLIQKRILHLLLNTHLLKRLLQGQPFTVLLLSQRHLLGLLGLALNQHLLLPPPINVQDVA